MLAVVNVKNTDAKMKLRGARKFLLEGFGLSLSGRGIKLDGMTPARNKPKQPMEGNLTMRQAVAARLRDKVTSEVSWKFGHASFQTGEGKVFCFITRDGNLAMKLPAERIESLVSDGLAAPMRMGQRTLREWVIVANPESAASLKLLREARGFVDSLPAASARRRPTAKKTAGSR